MLLVDPLKRITIPEIRQHPWFNTHLPRYLAVMQVRSRQGKGGGQGGEMRGKGADREGKGGEKGRTGRGNERKGGTWRSCR